MESVVRFQHIKVDKRHSTANAYDMTTNRN